jgi:hypothetical protein
MSKPVFERLEDDVKKYGKQSHEELEGLGQEKLHYIDFTEIQRDRPEMARAGFFTRFLAWFKFTLRALPFMAGTRKSCDGFRNFPSIEPPADLILPAGLPSVTPPSVVSEDLEPPVSKTGQ